MSNPRILLTVGEPAGIGVDIVLNILKQAKNYPAKLTIVTDPDLLAMRAKELGENFSLDALDTSNKIDIIPVRLNKLTSAGKLDKKNVSFVIECLTIATNCCLRHEADALVTGPVHKAIIQQAGFEFTGHTEFLAKCSNIPEVMMLFVTPKIKVGLITTHLALSQVPKAITVEKIFSKIKLLNKQLKKQFKIDHPVILVCGLNPHAGEMGEMGREEIEIILPALEKLQEQGINAQGCFGADTVFTEKYIKQADVIVGMYHDQVLPVVKYSDFQQAVNVTLGLPFVRTSVDHGVALDVAGTGKADPTSLMAAIKLAIKLQEK